MTGLDQYNMNIIENSFKKAFRSLAENSKSNNFENVEPVIFTKICISLLWSIKIYLLFKSEDPLKISKISLKSLQDSIFYHLIDGSNVFEKMSKFDFDLRNKKKKEIEYFMINNTITFSQVFDYMSTIFMKLIKNFENNSNSIIESANYRLNL